VMMPAISDLAARFSGQVLQPADAGYDEARRVKNGLIEPAVSTCSSSRSG